MVMVTLQQTLAPAFFGFTVGAILYGITLLQAYQYYSNSKHSKDDSIYRKATVGGICFLDTLHAIFASYLVYSFLVQGFGGQSAGSKAVWSFKAMATAQVLLVALVHWLYLYRIWILTEGLFVKSHVFIHVVILITAALSLVVAIAFLIELQGVTSILAFPASFQYMIIGGFATTVVIDCGIAATLCVILHLKRTRTVDDTSIFSRTDGVIQSLMQYCVATGLLTSLVSISCLTLYVAFPDTVLYLVSEFSITRLYANSMLALFNSRHRLREKLDDQDILISALCFDDPEPMPSHMSIFPEKTDIYPRRCPHGSPICMCNLRRHEPRYQTV